MLGVFLTEFAWSFTMNFVWFPFEIQWVGYSFKTRNLQHSIGISSLNENVDYIIKYLNVSYSNVILKSTNARNRPETLLKWNYRRFKASEQTFVLSWTIYWQQIITRKNELKFLIMYFFPSARHTLFGFYEFVLWTTIGKLDLIANANAH